MRAGHPRSMLKSPIELLRSVRLADIESSCAHLNSNCDLMILSRNIAGEERACNYGGGKDGTGAHDPCFGAHVNLLINSRDRLFGTLITSARGANWTPLNRDDGSWWSEARARQKIVVAISDLGDSYTR